jgi:GT2 family glycosyltransferase
MAENALRRIRTWLRRAKTAPAAVQQVANVQEDQTRDVHAVCAQVAALSERVAMLENRLLTELDGMREVTAERSELGLIATLTLGREAGMRDLLQTLGEPPRLRPGLSILTISWNHAGFLRSSVRSALATLDLLSPDEQGAVLVLDDLSSDETPQVLDELRAADGRVRPVHSPVNLGLSRARNVLLHVAETTHALMLDADNTAVPEGATSLYAVAREWSPAFTFGNVIMVDSEGTTLAVVSNEPPTTNYFFVGGPHLDTLGVLDVAYFRQIGGYNPDPAFHAFDDHEIIHRLARLGALIAFVPTVAGHYRYDRLSHSQTHEGAHAATIARLRRAYDQDGRLTAQQPTAMAAHPATGPLWATPAALAARPELTTTLPPAVEDALETAGSDPPRTGESEGGGMSRAPREGPL